MPHQSQGRTAGSAGDPGDPGSRSNGGRDARTSPNSRKSPDRGDRRRRRFWFDPRFAIGIGLVVVSALGVVAIVAVADTSVEVLAAGSDLTPGQRVTSADLVAASVQIGRADGLYLVDADVPAEGIVVTRSIAAGELVPTSSVGSVSGLGLTSIVLSLTSSLPESVETGSRVDLWSSSEGENGVFDAPAVIVPAATVVRVVEEEGLMMTGSGSTVEVLVPRSAIARVLEGIANGAAVSAVPVDLAMGE